MKYRREAFYWDWVRTEGETQGRGRGCNSIETRRGSHSGRNVAYQVVI